MTVSVRREVVKLFKSRGYSERRACALAGLSRSTCRYRHRRSEPAELMTRLRELASDGRLKLRVAGEYPPEQAAEAERVTDAGGLRGRAVIVF